MIALFARPFLPFRDAQIHLRDIKQSIDNISVFLKGLDFESYCADLKTRSAVERQMQIITEAAIRLGVDAEILCPDPDWRGFRGMGNVLRHEYHRVNDRLSGIQCITNCRYFEQRFFWRWHRPIESVVASASVAHSVTGVTLAVAARRVYPMQVIGNRIGSLANREV